MSYTKSDTMRYTMSYTNDGCAYTYILTPFVLFSMWFSMTHQAKGQEWPVVFVVRINEGILPLPPSQLQVNGLYDTL